MLRIVKVRLHPNKSQKQAIHRTFGSCRFVYNIPLDAKIKAYECRDNLSAYELKKYLIPMKKAQGGEFLKKMASTSVHKIDVTYKNFFRRVKLGEKAGFPCFKSKHNSYQSYQTSTASIKGDKLYLPKIGEVKAKFHKEKIIGKVKTVTISYEAGLQESIGTNNDKSSSIDGRNFNKASFFEILKGK